MSVQNRIERKRREESRAEQNRTAEDLLSKCAVFKLLPFPRAYPCEAGFSRYGATKSKYRYPLEVVPDMRIHLSATTPNFKGLCKTNKQNNSSQQ
jgi:hypothetical protein